MQFQKREVGSGDGGGDLFLKIKDGESKTGLFRGEVYSFFQKWENGKSTLVPKGTTGAKERFRLNFVIKDGGVFQSKIWEFGVGVYNQLASIAEDYEMDRTKMKITRHGEGLDTTYMILPLLKEPIPPSVMTEIMNVPLKMLEHQPKKESPPQDLFAPGDDEISF